MKSLANGVRAKTARTCDNCLKKRAHWFCAADEAFLCQSCDTSVHSANLLARRHERVPLKDTSPQQEAPTWHHGFTRKPRTPRGSGKRNNSSTFHDMVPEITAEGQTDSSEVEGPLICQVPVLDPMVVEPKIKFPTMRSGIDGHEDEDKDESCLNEIFPTNMEVEDFAADVETLLGHGLDKESYTMEELGLSNTEMLKKDEIEDKETKAMNMDIEICDDDQGNRDGTMPNGECVQAKEEKKKNVLMLSLDYDQVISTWGGQGLPWTSGGPPDIDINISGSPVVSKRDNGRKSRKKRRGGGRLPSSVVGDGGREARVSRYREKKKTRSFTKTIRYEVRKLNAENKPRMKGRFVKRASLAASAGNSPLGVNN
ncbi:BnaCnng04690D [Brassica napus]|uniref:BnaCnng04690D protein n=1 Tax=Brassica napus TaxID=3708 RepID=A0A078GGU3_BRANA|nr:BnaCnng04690D [Brassica napus]